jgi:hypothetical protein
MHLLFIQIMNELCLCRGQCIIKGYDVKTQINYELIIFIV